MADLILTCCYVIMVLIVLYVIYDRVMNPSAHRKPSEIAGKAKASVKDKSDKIKKKLRKE